MVFKSSLHLGKLAHSPSYLLTSYEPALLYKILILESWASVTRTNRMVFESSLHLGKLAHSPSYLLTSYEPALLYKILNLERVLAFVRTPADLPKCSALTTSVVKNCSASMLHYCSRRYLFCTS